MKRDERYRILVSIAWLMVLMLTGCGKNEFRIDFEFPQDHFGNYIVTYYASNSHRGSWMDQTASVQEGKVSLQCGTYNPTLVYITEPSNPSNSIVIYAERGDKIKISGDGPEMSDWTITGNKVTERWSEWRKEAYKEKGDTQSFEKSIEDYVKKNPSDKLSGIMMLTEWDRRENPEGFIKLWNALDEGVRTPRIIDMCGVSDLLSEGFVTKPDGKLEMAKDSGLKQMTVRSRDNGTDTLRFAKKKATFLYLFKENDNFRKETADSLKKLTKAYSDSASRIVADIYLDSDSMTWVNFIRRDSLEGVVRAWSPRGLAEEDMAKLGVIRTPWYVVKDKKGKDTYSGDELTKALSAFRKEMDRKEVKPARKDKKEENKQPAKPQK